MRRPSSWRREYQRLVASIDASPRKLDELEGRRVAATAAGFAETQRMGTGNLPAGFVRAGDGSPHRLRCPRRFQIHASSSGPALPAAFPIAASADSYYLTIAVSVGSFRTDVRIFNPASSDSNVSLVFVPVGNQNNGAAFLNSVHKVIPKGQPADTAALAPAAPPAGSPPEAVLQRVQLPDENEACFSSGFYSPIRRLAGIPRPELSERIIGRVSGRLPASTSETRLAEPT
jgi:hypothetical protein